MELYHIYSNFSNVPSKYKTICEWNDRLFTSLNDAQNASRKDRVQGGCNVVVEYQYNPTRAKEWNVDGDWVEVNTHRAM